MAEPSLDQTWWEKLGIIPTAEQKTIQELVDSDVPWSVARYIVANLPSTAYWSKKRYEDLITALTGYGAVRDKDGIPILYGTGFDPGWWAYQEQMNAKGAVQAMAANAAVQERIRQEQLEAQLAQRTAQQAEAERQQQIGERVRALVGRAPAEAAITAPFLEQARGVSPAFQEVARQQFLPDIFKELGMPQRRQEWWETGAQRIAEQLLPETQQERELMALKRADPWAQLLSQPTFLQQLETRFRGLSPGEKGVTTGRFRPRTRWLG